MNAHVTSVTTGALGLHEENENREEEERIQGDDG